VVPLRTEPPMTDPEDTRTDEEILDDLIRRDGPLGGAR
jgi:hypothetical protein